MSEQTINKFAFSCSVTCYKTHRDSPQCADLSVKNETISATKGFTDEEPTLYAPFSTEDTVPLDRLKQLSKYSWNTRRDKQMQNSYFQTTASHCSNCSTIHICVHSFNRSMSHTMLTSPWQQPCRNHSSLSSPTPACKWSNRCQKPNAQISSCAVDIYIFSDAYQYVPHVQNEVFSVISFLYKCVKKSPKNKQCINAGFSFGDQ